MHEYSGNQCTIRITANKPVKGQVTEHLPIGIEIIEHNGTLEIDNESIEPGTIPHRFVFDYTMDKIITYTTSEPIEKENYYWVTWSPGKPEFGYVDGDIKFSTN